MNESNLQVIRSDYSKELNENYSEKSDKDKLKYLEYILLQSILSDVQGLRFIAYHLAFGSFADSEFDKDNILYSLNSICEGLYKRISQITAQF